MNTEVLTHDKPIPLGKLLTTKLLLVAAFSFLICRCTLLGSISPFGVSFAAALPLPYGLITYSGGVLGYTAQGFPIDSILYLITMTLVLLCKIATHRTRLKDSPLFLACVVGITCFAVQAVGLYLLDSGPTGYLIRLCEAVFASGVTYFSTQVTQVFFRPTSLFSWSRTDQISGILLVLLGVIALMDIQLGVFSFGIIAACLLTQISLHKLGFLAGIVASILSGMAFNLYQVNYLPLAAMLIVSVLLAGCFRALGRMMQVALFLSGCFFSLFILGISLPLLYQMLNLLIGCGLFLVLSPGQLQWLTPKQTAKTPDMQQNIEARLGFAASTVNDLRETMQQLAELCTPPPDLAELYGQTIHTICKDCPQSRRCWQTKYSSTADAFYQMTKQLQQGKLLDANTEFADPAFQCQQLDKLTRQLNAQFQEVRKQQTYQRQAEKLQQLAISHLNGVSDTFVELSEEIGTQGPSDAHATQLVYHLFADHAVPPAHVFCNLNPLQHMEITIFTNPSVKYDTHYLQQEFCRCFGRSFAPPVISQADNKLKISFFEVALFEAETAICQLACTRIPDPKQICGDTCSTFSDNKGNVYLLLSDGMGSGKSAAIDSAFTCSVIFKLIRAGFSLTTVIQFVNSLLQIHRQEETLATVDLVKLDLYTGTADFYKAGSAPSFLYSNNHVLPVAASSLPVGILDEVDFQKRTHPLKSGDILVLLSDGILALTSQTISEELLQYHSKSAQQIANHLCNLAKQQRLQEEDDLTVLVAKIKQEKE